MIPFESFSNFDGVFVFVCVYRYTGLSRSWSVKQLLSPL